MSLEVLDPGLASRIVDRGRPGSRHLGVPVGGAADRTASHWGTPSSGILLMPPPLRSASRDRDSALVCRWRVSCTVLRSR